MQILQTQSGSSWQDQALVIIEARVNGGVCFSSGEVARVLRLSNPSLRFSVLRLGEFIRDLYQCNNLPTYSLSGGLYPVQVSRYTENGTEVFVYGPTEDDCESHSFEVDIPKPPSSNQASVLGHLGQAVQDAVDAMTPYVNPEDDGAEAAKLAEAQAGLKFILGI